MWKWAGKEDLSALGGGSGLICQGRQSASDFCKVRDYQGLVSHFVFFSRSDELLKKKKFFFVLVVMLCPFSVLVVGIHGR